MVRGGYVYLQGTLTVPPDGQAAYATIDRVRAKVHAVPGGHALVGGNTAVNLDIARAAAHDNKLLLPLILAVVFIILAILLRALVAPLILTATVVLSFAAALGVSAFFFNHVFGFGGADTSFPLLVYVFLVALGIDYNIFLMTRVREEAHRRDTRHGAITGLAATGGVITSAGFVLTGTFAALATLPSTFTTELGFAVAFGILLDTIIVRSVLVTALNLDIGRWMWWPSKLAHTPDPAPAELGHERARAWPGSDKKPGSGILAALAFGAGLPHGGYGGRSVPGGGYEGPDGAAGGGLCGGGVGRADSWWAGAGFLDRHRLCRVSGWHFADVFELVAAWPSRWWVSSCVPAAREPDRLAVPDGGPALAWVPSGSLMGCTPWLRHRGRFRRAGRPCGSPTGSG